LNETGTEALAPRQRWWRRRWVLWVGGALVALAIAGALAVEWGLRQMEPRMRRKVIATLSARFHSPVELDRLSLSMEKNIVVTGGGLRVLYLAGPTKQDAHPAAGRPMLVIDSFEFRTGWRELLAPTTRVLVVKVHGLQVNIPPKQEREAATPDNPRPRGQSSFGLAVDRVECTDAKVVLETNVPGKVPLEFRIGRVTLTDVGAKRPLGYEAVLVNPKPVGDVQTTGEFGPWQGDNPRDTPIKGSYTFSHADLGTIHGIGGVLDSTGTYGGTLGDLTVDGVADVPQFRMDISDHAMPLHVEFHAGVDGMTGDTRLDPVRARIGRSDVTASGSVTRTAGVQGHTTDLNMVMAHGRLEDMQTLSMKGRPSLMRGELTWRAHILIPPGPVSVSRKLALQGTFAIRGATLNDPKMQEKLDAMSMRAQGRPQMANAQDAEVVGSAASGRFSQANALLDVRDVRYEMPGATMTMEGQIQLVPSTFEFHGKVKTQATASQMTTGWKSMLLKPFDGMLKKNGAGLVLPIKVTGTRGTYDLRLDFPHDTHLPPGVDADRRR
jgi:hypothetical protein